MSFYSSEFEAHHLDPRIDASVRLRRAILDNDLSLVERIVKNNPKFLQNPDFNENSNTSLHLAAQNGFLEICQYLVASGHETSNAAGLATEQSPEPELSTSLNTFHNTALHVSAANSHSTVVRFLAVEFPHLVNRPNGKGATALMLACESVRPPSTTSKAPPIAPTSAQYGQTIRTRSNTDNETENTETLQALLDNGADVNQTDHIGNTALHSASAWGNLKAIRMLVGAGANPMARNVYSWTPVSYSCTVQAEVYFKNLVMEFEKKKVASMSQSQGGVRLVTDEGPAEDEMDEGAGK